MQNGSPVAIEENNLLSLIRVFPNPVKDDFIVEIDSKIVGANIAVYNLSGQLIYQSTLEGVRQEIKSSRWSKGVYVGMVTKNGKTTKVKMV